MLLEALNEPGVVAARFAAAGFFTTMVMERAVELGLGRIVALYDLLIHVIPYSVIYSVPLFLKGQMRPNPR